MLVPRKGTEFPWIAKRAARFIDQLGHNRVTLRCGTEPAIEALARENRTSPPRRKPDCSREESQSNGIIERAVGLVAGQDRTLKAALEHRIGTRVPARHRHTVLAGGICCVPDEQVRHRQRRTPLQRLHGRGDNTPILEFRREDSAHAGHASERVKMGTAIPSPSVCGDAELVIRGSGRHRARNGDQDTLNEHQENPRVGEMGRGQSYSEYELFHGPWMSVTMHSTFKSEWRDPRGWLPRDPGEVLMENRVARTHFRRADFKQRGLS